MKLAAEPGEDAQAQALEMVAAYTQIFNKMGFIETVERDEIYNGSAGYSGCSARQHASKRSPD